jgi:hypothetical protein
MSTYPIYLYTYGIPFEYVCIGNHNVELWQYAIVFNLNTKRIMNLAASVAERCEVVGSIDNRKLLDQLLVCLEGNLGFYTIPSADLGWYLKHHDVCRNLLMKFVSSLISETWTIPALKMYLIELNGNYHEVNNDIVVMVESILDRKLIEEANHLFMERKAKLIQRVWRDAISNPYHPCCKRRLEQEANELCVEIYG